MSGMFVSPQSEGFYHCPECALFHCPERALKRMVFSNSKENFQFQSKTIAVSIERKIFNSNPSQTYNLFQSSLLLTIFIFFFSAQNICSNTATLITTNKKLQQMHAF